jgi:hypothetical protein
MHIKNFQSETAPQGLMEEAPPQAVHVKNFQSETAPQGLMMTNGKHCIAQPTELKTHRRNRTRLPKW